MIDGDDAAATRVTDALERAEAAKETFLSLNPDAALVERFDEAISLLDDYRATFDQVAALQIRRERLVRETLDVVGPEVRLRLSDLIEQSIDGEGLPAVAHGGVAQQHWMLMRLYARSSCCPVIPSRPIGWCGKATRSVPRWTDWPWP